MILEGKPPETGRELLAHELKVGTIVVVLAPGHQVYVTLWVTQADEATVTMFAGELNWMVIVFVRPDGTIWDDQNRQVHVFEYLGEP